MMSKRSKQSTREASEWFAAQREGELNRAERVRFIDWLRESPAHVNEYLEVARLWDEMGEVDALQRVDVESELAKAERTVRELGSVSESTNAAERDASVNRPRRISRLWPSLAAGLLIAVTATWWAGWFEAQPDNVMTTTIGEQRSVTLEDGSVISLNTQTSIRVNFSPDERRAELLEGEALFDIVRDEQRPFVVTAGATEVRVLGTTFNVYREDSDTATVTVIEGRVAVMHKDPPNGAPSWPTAASNAGPGPTVPDDQTQVVELRRGQQAHIGGAGDVIEPVAVSLEKAVAWTDRRLIFEDTTLEDVLAEFNRYNTQELRVDDPSLAALQLNGVFESHDPDSLLQYLERAYDVRIRDDGNQRVVEAR